MGVVVVVVLRRQIAGGELVGTAFVAVAVLVDHGRRPVRLHEAVAEGLGQQARLEHLVGRAGGQQAAGQQHDDVRAAGLAEVVGRQDDRGADRGHLVDEVEDALLAGQVEAGDRLVEQQQVRLRREGLGHQHPLALPPGQIAERTLAQRLDVESAGGGGDGVPIVGVQPPEQPPAAEATHPQHVLHAEGHPAVLVLLLRDERDAGARRQRDAPVRRPNESGEQPEQRALAAAVGADEGGGRAPTDGQRARRQGDDRPVVDTHVDGAGDDVVLVRSSRRRH